VAVVFMWVVALELHVSEWVEEVIDSGAF
jgi:hypothetical protein